MRILAQMWQQQGRHKKAIALVDKALGFKKEDLVRSLLFVCAHRLQGIVALGRSKHNKGG
jgi:hypothetical protein